jgi:hypothetical protein
MPGREGDISPQLSEGKDVQNHSFLDPQIFMARYLSEHREKYTFTLQWTIAQKPEIQYTAQEKISCGGMAALVWFRGNVYYQVD